MRACTLPSLSLAFFSAVSLAAVVTAGVACSSSEDDTGAGGGDAGGGNGDSSFPPGPGAGDDGGSPTGDDGGGSVPGDGGQQADGASDGGGGPLADDGCAVGLPGDCDSPVAAYSLNAKIVSAYPSTAPLLRLVRIPDLAATVVLQAGQGSFAGGAGTPDVTQVKAWLASGPTSNSTAVVVTVFDQSGHGNDATQASPGAAPLLRIDDGVPAASALSMIFGNDTATVHAGYAGNAAEGSLLAFDGYSGTDPTVAAFATSPAAMLTGQPTGSPFPRLPTPDHWVLPGFLVQDRSLPDGGLPVVSATATTLTLAGAPASKKYGPSVTIVPEDTWLDLPAGVSVDGAHHTVVTAVRSGPVGTQELVTLGQPGGAPSGAGPYSSLSGASGPFTLQNQTQSGKSGTSLVGKSTISTDIDVYAVSRNGADVDFDLGEMGAGMVTDNAASTTALTGGSLGYTQQISAKNAGSFEGYGTLVYGTALSAHDAALFRASFRGLLGVPATPTTQVVYSGASTVVGHGIDSVEAPTKRLGVDLAAAGHPARTYVSEHFSEDLLTDLTTGGPVSALYKQGTGVNVLVIHPTLGDSFGNYRSGMVPSYCTTLEPDGGLDLAQCLWSTVSMAATAAHKMGWKVVIVSGEPKADVYGGTNGTLADFLEFKNLALTGWKAAKADGYVDLETSDAIGGSDGQGHPSHCPFWRSACIPGYVDPIATEVNWQPDGQHLSQSGYDASADVIAKALLALDLY